MSLEAAMRDKLQVALSPTALVLTNESHKHKGHAGAGSGSHWHLHIVSAAFSGLSLVARHKLIYKALAEELRTEVHALAIDAHTPDETGV